MMEGRQPLSPLYVAITVALAICIFAVDLMAQNGVAVGVLYLLPLMILFRSSERLPILLFAMVCTVLTGLGGLYSPPGGTPEKVFLNRALTMFVIWAATLLYLQRTQAQTGLRTAEGQLGGILQSAMDAIITIDEKQHITLFNPAAERMFGCSAAEALGESIDRFLPERFRDAHRDHVRHFGETEVTNRRMGALGSVIGLRADGEEFPVEASISQTSTGGGKLYTVIMRDITEGQKAQQTLQKERDFITAVLDTAGALVVVLDTDGRILRFNRACEKTTGYTFQEVKEKKVWDFLLLPEETEPVKAIFQALRGGQLSNNHANYWVTKERKRRLITWSNTIMLNNQRDVEYIIGTGLDVTDLKQMREQLRRTERVAELGTLASGMAHEIGTPMNVILGRAEYLMRRTVDETTKKGLEIIITQVERITRIMNQLLTFARRRPIQRRAIDLRHTIKDALDVLEDRLKRHQIHVETRFEPGVPLVHADPDQMTQVLLNLFINAVHAMPEGGTLRLELDVAGDHVRMTVTDSGQGIPPEHLPKIFDPFFTTKDVGKGTGLGLTVVHGIVQEHGGSITVESQPGRGTTFALYLPIHQT